ncbi:hypothetical protein [Candidatus Nitrososphaera evergladensis]|uniref:hypothetical protein n=1 Tax=Candidatus Nitrososphaera evergladensis TaxID=1459637 RepID=UPI0011E5EF75|nr:hypothetical protein [Candidatus Nitrososphaera evergladensis]
MATLEVTIHREGNIVCIDGTKASVTFKPRDKDKTFKALIEKCALLDKGFEDKTELEYLKNSIEIQLTQIYQDYERERARKEKPKKKDLVVTREIKKLDISFEDWQKQLFEKYNKVKEKADALSPHIWPGLDFALSVKMILHIKNCTLPFFGVILGRPSSWKTFIIELFRDAAFTKYSDAFTPKAFVSHYSGFTEEELKEIDLLPKIKDSTFLTPELSPIFTKREEELTELFGIITRILDGHGYTSDSGAQGSRGYHGEYMFTWIGAGVEVPRRVHKLLGTLGPKLYFFRLKADDKSEEDYVKALILDDYPVKRNALVDAMSDYLSFFERGPAMELVAGVPKMKMENAGQDDLKLIVRLAKLLGRLRGVIPTWETSGTEGANYAYSLPTIEEPSRAITLLYNLSKGHALAQGRTCINLSDIASLINVVLSTAPVERVAIFDLLLAHDGVLTTTDITEGLNTTNPTARRTMTELKALGLVHEEQDGSNHEWKITLKEEFAWFKSDQFIALRGGHFSFSDSDNERNKPIHGSQFSFSDGSESMAERNLAYMEGQFICPLCNYDCKTYDELERHAVQKHPGKAVIAEWSMKHKQVELGGGLGKPVGETAAKEGGNKV